MDIAKIRKKRKKKEKKKKGKQEIVSDALSETVIDDAVREVSSEIVEKIDGKEVAGQDTAPVIQEHGPDEGEDQELTPLVEFLVFKLAGEHYAFRLSDLKEVLRSQIITFVPKMPVFIVGITSLRGKIIPVMDLTSRLSIKGEKKEMKRQIAIIKGAKGPIGMIIDKVVGVRRVEESGIKEPPSHLDDNQVRFIDSVVRDDGKFISVLNIDEVLSFKPMPL